MPAITTDPASVAALLRARLKDEFGNELPNFSEETRPTLDQVTVLIERARRRIVSAIGTEEPCHQDLVDEATELVHQRAAMLVELSYFPEQVNSDRSPYDQVKALFDEDLQSLIEAVSERCGTGTGGAGVDQQLPSYYFGDPYLTPPIGKGTIW